MKKLITAFLLFFLFVKFGNAQTPATFNANELKEGQTQPNIEFINGYPATDYYFTQTKIPQEVLNSTNQAEKIQVAFHNRMVAWEKTNQRPLKSLAKNDMESLIIQLYAEANKEIVDPGKVSATQK